jgi:hypothetical protein
MNDVKRYECQYETRHGSCCMLSNNEGDWIKYDDYVTAMVSAEKLMNAAIAALEYEEVEGGYGFFRNTNALDNLSDAIDVFRCRRTADVAAPQVPEQTK